MTDVPGQMNIFGEPEPEPKPAEPKPRKRRKQEEWAAEGDVDERGFCRACRSHFCTHAQDWLYGKQTSIPFESMEIDPASKARSTDSWTAHNAAEAVAKMGQAKNQRWQLFAVYASALGERGLTSEEAMNLAPGVSPISEYSTRCSELQRLGLISPTGKTRRGAAGVERDVYRITDRGRSVA